MTQIDWGIDEENNEFWLTCVEDYEGEFDEDAERYKDNPFGLLHELVNECSQMTGGMRGNSGYEIMSYADMLINVDHKYYSANMMMPYVTSTPKRTQLVLDDIMCRNKFYLKNAFNELYQQDWHFVAELLYDNMGNIIGVYDMWAWSKMTNPISELKRGKKLVFKPVNVYSGWRMIDTEVVYSLDGKGPIREIIKKRADRKPLNYLAWHLWQEYPYVASVKQTVKMKNILGDYTDASLRTYRQYNVLDIHGEYPCQKKP